MSLSFIELQAHVNKVSAKAETYKGRKPRTFKLFPGNYLRSFHGNVIDVHTIDLDDGVWWIAASTWDKHYFTDPVPTKQDAIEAADEMLQEKHA
jgi:hypothetical protein